MSTDRTTSRLYSEDRALSEIEGVKIPRWIESDITTGTVAAIIEGGCDSGAYMPSVTYSDAIETMGSHGDDVIEYLDEQGIEIPKLESGGTWSQYACAVLSCAVETWANGIAESLVEAIDAEDEDEDEDEGEDEDEDEEARIGEYEARGMARARCDDD